MWWKLGKNKIEKVGVPGKVLWYFPPIPRFKRMFQSTSTAQDLTWHANERVKDDKMRQRADSRTWKLVDKKWPEFGSEPRNLRLALSSDGFNPHSSLSSKYSCWPVILVSYNLPPWLCMKRKYMMLTMLISGPKQPGNDIDVYLQPLIDDLQTLWDGVEGVYDAYKGEYFKLKAVLFWTINDFPAYGNLSGSIVKGYNACPASGKFDLSETSKPLSGATMIKVVSKEFEQAHLCVLQNTDEVRPYFDEHLACLKRTFPKFKKNEKWLREKQNKTFAKWIRDKVASQLCDANQNISEHLRWIADGPNPEVPTFSGY